MAVVKFVGENGNYGLKNGKEYKGNITVKNSGVVLDLNGKDVIRMSVSEYRKNFKYCS